MTKYTWFLSGVACVIVALTLTGTTPRDYSTFRQEAITRGYMVLCYGEAGYKWECEE